MNREEKIRRFEMMELMLCGNLAVQEQKKILEDLGSSQEYCAEVELNHIINAVLRNESFFDSVKPPEINRADKIDTAEMILKTEKNERSDKKVSNIQVPVSDQPVIVKREDGKRRIWLIAAILIILLTLIAWFVLG